MRAQSVMSTAELLELGAPPQVILARLRRPEGTADAASRTIFTPPTAGAHGIVRRLPLHAAVARAAATAAAEGGAAAEELWAPVFDLMLELHPKAAESRDAEGFTPMHLAASASLPPSFLHTIIDQK